MDKNESSNKTSRSSNMVLKIGVTYIIPIFLAISGAIMISKDGWNYIFERCYFSPNIEKSQKSGIKLAEYNINGKKVNKPFLNQQFAKMTIDSIGINEANIFEGYKHDTLKLGIGHDIASYIPGEGGVTVFLGYRSMEFSKLKNISNGDSVIVETSYGKYHYRVESINKVDKSQKDFINYNEKAEKLVMYTEYPFDTLGDAYKYFVVTCDYVRVE